MIGQLSNFQFLQLKFTNLNLHRWLDSPQKMQLRFFQISSSNVRYKLINVGQKYFYLRCCWKGCKSKLRYKWHSEDNEWVLTSFYNIHQHQLPKNPNFQFAMVKDYLQSTKSFFIPPSSLRHVICEQFGVNNRQFYYLLAKTRNKNFTFQQMILWLEENSFEVFLSDDYKTSRKLPQVLVASTSKMKEYFNHYGDLISFDLSFNLIKNRTEQDKKWKIGIFLGTSAYKRMVPLAIVATLHETKQSYLQIFRAFFQAMSGLPKIIVTDEEKAMKIALQQLNTNGQWKGKHLNDSYHILHNIRKRLSRKEDIVTFSHALHAITNYQFLYQLDKLKAILPLNEHYLVQQLMKKRQNCCYSQIQNGFIAFGPSSSPNKAFHSLFKKIQSSQKDYCITIKNLAHYSMLLLQKCHKFQPDNNLYEIFFKLPQLKFIRSILSKSIMIKFMEQLARCLKAELVESQGDSILIMEYKTIYVVKCIGQKKFKCNCSYMQKSQLPCCHLLRVLINNHIPIITHIPMRWILHQSFMIPEHPGQKDRSVNKRGRQKSSKRKLNQ